MCEVLCTNGLTACRKLKETAKRYCQNLAVVCGKAKLQLEVTQSGKGGKVLLNWCESQPLYTVQMTTVVNVPSYYAHIFPESCCQVDSKHIIQSGIVSTYIQWSKYTSLNWDYLIRCTVCYGTGGVSNRNIASLWSPGRWGCFETFIRGLFYITCSRQTLQNIGR